MRLRQSQARHFQDQQAKVRVIRRHVMSGLVLCGVAFLGVWFWHHFLNDDAFPINTAKIEGRFKHLERAEIEDMISPYISQGFFTVHVSEVRNAIESNPWVEFAGVSRVWPDRLVVKIKEQVPVVTWNNEGFLSERGVLFRPVLTSVLAELPTVNGPENREKFVFNHYQSMQDMLNSLGLKISSLELSNRGAWEIKLDNGMRLELGRADVLERMKRFVSSYDRVFGSRGSEVDYVDLRYTNGMAVHWKS